MPLAVTAFPDIKQVIGESARIQDYQLQPGANDYVTGGYPITAAEVELGFINGATISGVNAAGAVYLAQFVFPATSFNQGTPAVPAPATTVHLMVLEAPAAISEPFAEVAAGTNLSGVTWLGSFRGW